MPMTGGTEEIAIVGIAAQLPSGSGAAVDLDYDSFWSFLVNGGSAFEPVDNFLSGETPNHVKMPTQGSFLKNASSFDNIALGVGIRDARVLPYSGRRLLDLSFQALSDSGINSRGLNIGCFMSGNMAGSGEYSIDTDGSTAWMPYAVANRISYALDLTGPSIFLDTACSSSLMALHLAIRALEQKDCSAALVGAAQINRDKSVWASYVQAGVLSAEGVSKPFDEMVDGFGRGEGAVVIVIKPLKDALRDNDHVYSVIVGSAINTTGSGMPLNVPNGSAQQQCIYAAYKSAGLHPRDADYIELHATGTSVGDPIETNAAVPLFMKDRNSPANFGSVKGNIGHLEVAAFMASLVKACLIFKHGVIPPTVNLTRPSRNIQWDEFNTVVPTKPISLGCCSPSGRSIISISSAGIGGSTGHVVLQAPPPSLQSATAESPSSPVLFLVGGLSSTVVSQIAEATSLLDAKDLPQYAVTLARRARQLPWRTYFTLPPSSPMLPAILVPSAPPPIAFVFSGQGPQNLEMGRQLFAEYPVFRNTILELDAVYHHVRGVSLMESTGLFSGPSSPPSITLLDSGWPVIITVSAIAMLQMALFDVFESLGIVPDAMLGHSAGETAALYASGAGPKAMALEIAIARGEAMECTEGLEAGMAVVACSTERTADLMARITANEDGILELSCYNTPESVAVSGTTSLLNTLVALAKREGHFAQRIRTMVPGHCSFMDPIKADYLARMEDIFARYPGPHVPKIPVFSTSQNNRLVEEFTPSYFWDNCRNAVDFSTAVLHSLGSSPCHVFVEISCHPVLSASVVAHAVPEARVLCPMRRISDKKAVCVREPEVFLDTIGQLSLLGVNCIDLSGIYGFSALNSKHIEHPLISRAIPPPKSLITKVPRPVSGNEHPLSANLSINTITHPDLAEHVINGEPVFPATAFIELVLEAGANFLWDVEFVSILSLATASSLVLQRLDSDWSITSNIGTGERVHARGFLDIAKPADVSAPSDFSGLWKSLPPLDFDGFYSSLAPLAAYGPRFKRVIRCHGSPAQTIAEIRGPTADELAQNYLLHPVLLDACLHLVLHRDISKEYSKDTIYLPSRLEHLFFYRRQYTAGNWFSHIQLRRWTPDYRYYDILIADSSGLALCEMRNLVVKKFRSAGPVVVKRRFDLTFQPAMCSIDLPCFHSTFPQKPNKGQVHLLYSVLDTLAMKMILNSLKCDIAIGKEVSRQRYLAFALRALKCQNESAAPEAIQSLRRNWPSHFEVTDRLTTVHESVFGDSKRALDALYSGDLMAKLYTEVAQTSNACSEATSAFSEMLASFRRSGKRSIKLLEVGAGTGLLTYHLIDELQRNPDVLVEYTVTDTSYALAANLAHSLLHPFVFPKVYDISKDPNAQGVPSESYDIIVGLHVLHAAPDVQECLGYLQKLLVPGGCLLIVELNGVSWHAIPGNIWVDCVFGSFPEWFGYTDERDHCSLAPGLWQKYLEMSNFTDVQTCVEAGETGRDFYFVAHKPLSPYSADSISADTRCVYTYQFGRELDLQQWILLQNPPSSAIYILALQGRDADAARGLCVTLRKEFSSWNIRLCMFEALVDILDPIQHISRHKWIFDAGDDTVFFDCHGAAQVLRIVLSSPSNSSSDNDFVVSNTQPAPDSLEIRVSKWAGLSSSYDGFVGQVISKHAAGEYVGGFTQPSSEPSLLVSANNIVLLAENHTTEILLDFCFAMVTSVVDPLLASAPNSRILFAVENQDLAVMLQNHAVNMIHLRLEVLSIDFRAHEDVQRIDILVTDSHTYQQHSHLRRWLPRSGRAILWDDQLKAELARDPSYLRGILNTFPAAKHEISSFKENGNIESALAVNVPVVEEGCPSVRAALPFRSDRAYVLLGGIGGLGIDLAVWLYERGARIIVLTSRRGIKSLNPIDDSAELAKIAFLKNQSDVHLRLESCDGTDSDATAALLRSLPAPIAGCFHMTLALSDALFVSQTKETFEMVHNSKLRVWENFSALVDVSSLDFFVALSSISGLFGIPGQSNYASACTALDGALANYSNAFSLITPGIWGAGYLDRGPVSQLRRRKDLGTMTTDTLWACLEDGLRKLQDGPFNQYIPDLNWNLIHTQSTLPPAYKHLLHPSNGPAPVKAHADTPEQLLSSILELLEVSASDFDPTQPFVKYGLDSLSATTLSSLLQPYISVSQMQLLGGATWASIAEKIRSLSEPSSTLKGSELTVEATDILLKVLGISSEGFHPHIPLRSYDLHLSAASHLAAALKPFVTLTPTELMGEETWAQVLTRSRRLPPDDSAQAIVEIRGGSGMPLIILPGSNGSVTPFFILEQHFQGPLWAIQITDSTPLDSLSSLVKSWQELICAKKPHGPYRFAAFSASALSGVLLAKMMEDAGEEVAQLTFIENSPTVWIKEEAEALLRTKTEEQFCDIFIDSIVDMLRNDPSISSEAVGAFEAAVHSNPKASANSRRELEISRTTLALTYKFLKGFYPVGGESSYSTFIGPFMTWVSSFDARVVVIVAEDGIVRSSPGRAWPDLGASRLGKPVMVHRIPSVGHWGLLADERVWQILQV